MSACAIEIAPAASDGQGEPAPRNPAGPGRLDPTGFGSLIGRTRETRLLDRLLDAVRLNEGRALIIEGEPGVGKTALLNYARAATPDFQLLRAAGVESERELPFSTLHQLFAPMLETLERLPVPQRDSLSTAFGLRAGPSPDRLVVGVAVMGLLFAAAADQPLLCLIDDLQWVDRASSKALAFVARRIAGSSLGLLFGTRSPSEELKGLRTLRLSGLDTYAARTLLHSVVPKRLDDRVRQRVIAETQGNPRALLELPRRWPAMQLAGGFGMADTNALSGRTEESFVRRLEALPNETRRLLLVAAAEPLGDPLVLWSAAEQLEINPAVAESAQEDGLLAIDDRVTFSHPLVRSAAYRAATAEDRRATHRALAKSTDGARDLDLRTWHLAMAAIGPDEQVALALERSTAQARARGGVTAAAAFLQRSVALTRDADRRPERALGAAEAHLEAGAFDAARRLLTVADAGILDEFQSTRVVRLRGHIAFGSGAGSAESSRLLLRAAERLEGLDLALARDTYLSAFAAAAFAGPPDTEHLFEICRAARALPSSRPPSGVNTLLDGLTLLIMEGRSASIPVLRQAAKLFASGEVSGEEGSRWGWLAAAGSNAIWDPDSSRAIYDRHVKRVREAGALERLPRYLSGLGTIAAWSGEFDEAMRVVADIDSVAAATGARLLPDVALFVLALQGRAAEAANMITATISSAEECSQTSTATTARWAAAVLYNSLGRYDDALLAAQGATSDPLKLHAAVWALPELAEAAARRGRFALANQAVQQLADTTRASGTEFALGVEARSRALISHGPVAEELYREATERLGNTRLGPELGRAHLVYGEWLRRQSRRVDARAQLRSAYDLFATIGMMAFAERARAELQATGENSRPRTSETRDDLTEQERHIAELARDGLSNPEIGARLFLSPRTVEWHLRKIFGKLSVRSRRELATVLPDSDLTRGAGLISQAVDLVPHGVTRRDECAGARYPATSRSGN